MKHLVSVLEMMSAVVLLGVMLFWLWYGWRYSTVVLPLSDATLPAWAALAVSAGLLRLSQKLRRRASTAERAKYAKMFPNDVLLLGLAQTVLEDWRE